MLELSHPVIAPLDDRSASLRPSVNETTAAFRRGPMRFIDVGHSLLAYWRFGTGPDLVFVHGWPLHSATFRGVISRLADAFTCHVVDLPAAGQSVSQPDAPIDFAAHAVALRRAIDDLGLRRYALVVKKPPFESDTLGLNLGLTYDRREKSQSRSASRPA